jgi:hypothetical protein
MKAINDPDRVIRPTTSTSAATDRSTALSYNSTTLRTAITAAKMVRIFFAKILSNVTFAQAHTSPML